MPNCSKKHCYSFGRGYLLTSVLIELFNDILKLAALSHTMLLANAYGWIAVGVGLGLGPGVVLVLRGNGSTGGSNIIAHIVSGRSHLKSEQVIMVLTGAPSGKVVPVASRKSQELCQKIGETLGAHGAVRTGKT